MINGLKLASIPVRDQDRALAFYTRTLGFELATDAAFGPGQRWIELKVPGATTKLVLYTPQGQEDRIGTFSNLVFASDDVEATYEELRRRGVEFVQPPRKESWGTGAVFKDSEGNSFALSTTS